MPKPPAKKQDLRTFFQDVQYQYLPQASRTDLSDLLLQKLNKNAELRKALVATLTEAIDNLSFVRLVQILRDHPDGLVEILIHQPDLLEYVLRRFLRDQPDLLEYVLPRLKF